MMEHKIMLLVRVNVFNSTHPTKRNFSIIICFMLFAEWLPTNWAEIFQVSKTWRQELHEVIPYVSTGLLAQLVVRMFLYLFFPAFRRFIKHRVSDYQSVKSFYSFYFFLSASQRFFFFLLSSICAHINIWSTIIAVSHIMDNAQLRVMKKKNNKKIASLDKKNKKNKNFNDYPQLSVKRVQK